MSRAVLMECAPWAAWMAGAFVLLWVLVRISGARWNFSRLKAIHSCQQGGTQTVSFVLTLPVFIMVVLFIVQVSQLMIAVTVVHYAAFAAARAATVWLPAEMPESFELANRTEIPVEYNGRNWSYPAYMITDPQSFELRPPLPSWKLRKIWLAAVYACAPVAPSRDLYGAGVGNPLGQEAGILASLYRALSPTSQANPRIPIRLQNKMNYAARHTTVQVKGYDKEFIGQENIGPTYAVDPSNNYARIPQEIGWDDPLTITVQHRFALLPGPAHLLARRLVNQNGQADNVSGTIFRVTGNSNQEQLYATLLTASLTFTNEGLKSAMPYVEYND